MVFKVAAAKFRDLDSAFAAYDPLIDQYHQLGIRTLLVLNQETFWGQGPWDRPSLATWQAYAQGFADQVREIATHYRGKDVAYQIWNESDIKGKSSVFVPPDFFAPVLERVATAIREQDDEAAIVLGGLASGPEPTVAYIEQLRTALGGDLPVDAIGLHPYGRWPTTKPNIPTGWFDHLEPMLNAVIKAAARTPVWITEIGVSEDDEIDPAYWPAIADYVEETLTLVQRHYARHVPVVMWFGWSDWMRNAGIVDHGGNPKQPIYDRFFDVIHAPIDEEEEPAPIIPGATELTSTADGLRVREGPGTTFDILTHVDRGDRLQTREPWEAAWAKLGQPAKWIQIQAPDDVTGWSAAWYLNQASDVPEEAPPLVTITSDFLRVRSGPGLQFAILDEVHKGDVMTVLENWPTAIIKLGQSGEWINIRTMDGREGWVAAWYLRLPTTEETQAQIPTPIPALPTVRSDEVVRQALAFEREISFDRVPVCDPSDVASFSGFGPNNYSYLTYARGEDYYRNLQGLHNGLDFVMPEGTPLCSVDWGVVAYVSQREDDNPYGAGPYSLLVRYGRYVALYGHLQGCTLGKDVFVKTGDIVAPGQLIGLSGISNNAPHLHFEMRNVSQAYINQLRREAEAFTQDPFEQLRHMDAHFGIHGWRPTQTYYVNPAPFFEPRLESYQQTFGWRDPSPLDVDRDNNGYPDQIILAGQNAAEGYDLYSLKAMATQGAHFWRGSVNPATMRGFAAADTRIRSARPRGGEAHEAEWQYVG
jgi:murein DD-endopeptidase MepM/ murein hydrolase activator NlpD